MRPAKRRKGGEAPSEQLAAPAAAAGSFHALPRIRALGTLATVQALQPLDSFGSVEPIGPLDALRPFGTFRPVGAPFPLTTLRALAPVRPLDAAWGFAPLGPFSRGRAVGTIRHRPFVARLFALPFRPSDSLGSAHHARLDANGQADRRRLVQPNLPVVRHPVQRPDRPR
ncbi:MAG: hypothetical protein ACREJ9_10420 [Candidatus Rokuibacteriota bacterium]